jgi:hypothetical protein
MPKKFGLPTVLVGLAFAMEEFAEPMYFTTEAHRVAVDQLLAQSRT